MPGAGEVAHDRVGVGDGVLAAGDDQQPPVGGAGVASAAFRTPA